MSASEYESGQPMARAALTFFAALMKGDMLVERLGPILIHMKLQIDQDRFSVVPERWSLLGLPLPRALMPANENFETEVDGKFQFNVSIVAPLVGPIVSYRGSLEVSDV